MTDHPAAAILEPHPVPIDTVEFLQRKGRLEHFEPNRFQEETNRFIRELVAEKDRFKRVFKTEKGSIYFVFEEGSCVRAKSEDGLNFEFQPVTKKLFFLSPTDVKYVQGDLYEPIDGITHVYPFKAQDYRVGVVPFEFDAFGVIQVEEDSVLKGYIEIKSSIEEVKDSGTHFGHTIVEILK